MDWENSHGKRNDSTAELVAIIVKRSAPNRNRPRCSDDCEARLAQVEEETAACYGRSELLAAKMRRLARIIDENDENTECPEEECDRTLANPPDPEFNDDEDSIVIHIDKLRAQAKTD